MNIVKKQNVFGWISIAAGILAIVGMIIYIVSSLTGFMSGQSMNAIPIVFAIIAAILLIGAPLVADKFDSRIPAVADLIAVILLAVSMCIFVNARVQVFQDVWFIPVNHPVNEDTALTQALVGIIFYVIATVVAIIPVFAGSLVKKKAQSASLEA